MPKKDLGILIKKDVKILLTAVVLGIISIIILNAYVGAKTRSEEMVPVVVAVKEIEEGIVIEKNMLDDKEYPKSIYNKRMIGPGDKATIIGRAVKIRVPSGVPMLWNYIAATTVGAFSDKLDAETHERVLRLSLKGPVDVVRPEDRIDIMGTFREGKEVTKLLLPNVTVLDKVGRDLYLKVFPEEAYMLTLAGTKCELSFTLRSAEDVETYSGKNQATLSDIIPMAERLTKERIKKQAIEIKKH